MSNARYRFSLETVMNTKLSPKTRQ